MTARTHHENDLPAVPPFRRARWIGFLLGIGVPVLVLLLLLLILWNTFFHYVPPGKMAEGRVQYCEHVTPAQVWREEFVNPLGLSAVYVVADEPEEVAARWGRFSGLLPRLEDGLVRLHMARGQVRIGKRSTIENALGNAPAAPAIAGYALSCSDPDAFASRCRNAGLTVVGRTVTLPEALGGAWLLESRAKEEY